MSALVAIVSQKENPVSQAVRLLFQIRIERPRKRLRRQQGRSRRIRVFIDFAGILYSPRVVVSGRQYIYGRAGFYGLGHQPAAAE